MDPVPDPLLLRKSGSAGNRTRDQFVSHAQILLRRCVYMRGYRQPARHGPGFEFCSRQLHVCLLCRCCSGCTCTLHTLGSAAPQRSDDTGPRVVFGAVLCRRPRKEPTSCLFSGHGCIMPRKCTPPPRRFCFRRRRGVEPCARQPDNPLHEAVPLPRFFHRQRYRLPLQY
jgi:hypothetical protein